jgi:hypothetical protein
VAGRDARRVWGVRRGEVRQRIALEIGPEDLDRIELGCVGRQQGDVPAAVMQVLRDDLGPVTRQPVPDEDKGGWQMARERAENGTNHAVVTFSLARSEKYRPVRREQGDRVRAAMMDTFSRARPR